MGLQQEKEIFKYNILRSDLTLEDIENQSMKLLMHTAAFRHRTGVKAVITTCPAKNFEEVIGWHNNEFIRTEVTFK